MEQHPGGWKFGVSDATLHVSQKMNFLILLFCKVTCKACEQQHAMNGFVHVGMKGLSKKCGARLLVRILFVYFLFIYFLKCQSRLWTLDEAIFSFPVDIYLFIYFLKYFASKVS